MSKNSLRFVSQLFASSDAVWASISTMKGVNFELSPLLHMTYPQVAAARNLVDAPLGVVAFQSYLLLFGVMPIDRHAVRLMEVLYGDGFVEDSTSFLQQRWRHQRRVVAAGERRCTITGELLFTPRVPFFAPLVRHIVRVLFDHRHQRLHQRFGGERIG